MGGPRLPRLDQLDELSYDDLVEQWARLNGAPAPNISDRLLRLGIGHAIQVRRQGTSGIRTDALIRQALAASDADGGSAPHTDTIAHGTRLVRDWHGTGHTVTVLEEGFEYDGRHWRSLSAIAKAITGSHWSGRRFFGLTGART